MQEATLIYPHQLFNTHPAVQRNRRIYLVEEPLFLTEFPVHTQKLLLHRLSMQHYARQLEVAGYMVVYLDIQTLTDSDSVFKSLCQDGITHVHIVDTTDNWLEKRIENAVQKYNLTVTRYESPLFILPKAEAVVRYQKSGKHMARFYKQLRSDKKILVDNIGEPLGGKWSFDSDNRKKIPKGFSLPDDIASHEHNADLERACMWLETVPGERYGSTSVWVPWTAEAARISLEEFVANRLQHFGDYEDAIVTKHTRLFHSALSPLINIGLLTPQDVLSVALEYGRVHNISLNNLEGFVRQMLGWREFIRASYECDGSAMRTRNFWNFTRSLPKTFWNASTGVQPIDIAIKTALQYGYNHHIERLMVLGNFMLLSQINPDDVYRWFMALYIDAYDWVMVPNVYGMSQFADGGIFATKPYISGSSYLKKMSDYPRGEWEELWTALYWNFIEMHRDFFLSNHRLSMMPKMLERITPIKQSTYKKIAHQWLVSGSTKNA